VRLLGTGTESRLLARRLEAVGLQNALEGLGRGALASTAAASRLAHGGDVDISSGGGLRHFV